MSKLIVLASKNKPFEIFNKTEKIAEILLYSQIGSSFWEEGVTAKSFAEELKKLPESTKEIHLRVNSPGGSVFDGMTIYENLKAQKSKHKRKIVAYVDGLAASIASVIIMAADEIVVGDGSMIMIHKPLVGTYGNSTEHERMINILDKIEEQMISIYATKTGMSRAEISKALLAETYYTSDEAVDLGFADSKFKAEDTLKLCAMAFEGAPWLKNKPQMQSQNDIVRAKLREFTDKNKNLIKK